MSRKGREKDLEGQMIMSFDFPNHLLCEGVKVEASPKQNQDSQKVMEGKRVFEGTGNLMEKVADANNLWEAWRRVRANKGSGGIDGQSIEEFERKALSRILEMQTQMLAEKYKPTAVRGVQIPKPNGGTRQLGIPTVKDRIVQQAMAQVISPLYEKVFSESSYGFRPSRSAHQAVKQGSAYVAEGYSIVVDLDLEKFFDEVNHTRLMARLARDIKDRRVLRLIVKFLKVGLMQNGVCARREQGTPQGGPLSPLLANIVLDELDKELERRGHRFCRYADDCNIYVKSQKAGERVMEGIKQFITRKLRLKVNEAKSKVANSKECTFLGYTIGDKGKLWISKKSKARIKTRIKALTRRNRGRKLEAIIGELNQTLRGWLMYFRLAEAKRWCKETEKWLRRKLRCYRLKQCKRRIGIARFLMQNGCTEYQAWETAMCRNGWWRKSRFAQANKAMGNEWFRNLGLIPFALPKS